jgi:nitric oxide reductase subunit B
LSIFGVDWAEGSPLWDQQWEYLDLPRVWQVLLTVGMFLWIAIIYRGIRSRLKTEHRANMPWLFFYAGLAIPGFYAVGMLAGTDTHLTVAEFWRFWVVHLWVEDFLELFTTVMVAYIFVMLGVVRKQIALGIIFLDVILYSVGGVIGTMHHIYFSGTPVEHMALGAFFSALEVIPLTFLTVEAWTFLQLGSSQESRSSAPFPHRWAVMFLVAVGFWNFLGAGVFGFLINLPIVSYYQIGTALTANHAHGAMMGVYGMMGVGLALFALRYLIPKERWPDKFAKISFWSLNIGLAWMVFATLLPLGVIQLWHSVNDGYYEARSLSFITTPGNALLEWLRMPGDVIFLGGGVLPFLWITWLGVRYRIKSTTHDVPTEALFAEEELVAITRAAEQRDAAADRRDRADATGSRYASDRRGSTDDQSGVGGVS